MTAKMPDEEFKDLLNRKTARIVTQIAEQNGWGEEQAKKRFMESKLYSLLKDEETKVWHYSVTMLVDLFDDERGGHLVLPDV